MELSRSLQAGINCPKVCCLFLINNYVWENTDFLDFICVILYFGTSLAMHKPVNPRITKIQVTLLLSNLPHLPRKYIKIEFGQEGGCVEKSFSRSRPKDLRQDSLAKDQRDLWGSGKGKTQTHKSFNEKSIYYLGKYSWKVLDLSNSSACDFGIKK